MKNNKGFTLVEISIAIALSSIIVLILSKNLTETIKLQQFSNNKLKAIHLAQKSMEEIETYEEMPIEGIYIQDKNLIVRYKYNISTKTYNLNFNTNLENNSYSTDYCKIYITVENKSNNEILYELYSEKRL